MKNVRNSWLFDGEPRITGVHGDIVTFDVNGNLSDSGISATALVPGASAQMVVVQTNGSLGVQAIPAAGLTTSYATVFSAPTQIQNTSGPTMYVCKNGGMVTVVFNSYTVTLTTNSATINFGFGTIPSGYQPVSKVQFPQVFQSNGVYDTGLVGLVVIGTAGDVTFNRDIGGPGVFTGSSGWPNAVSFSYLTV